MTMCETCEEVQQQLLADGGGACGQIICNHQDDRTLVIEDGVEDDASTVLSTFSPITAAVVGKNVDRTSNETAGCLK